MRWDAKTRLGFLVVLGLMLTQTVAWSSLVRRYTGREMAQLADAIFVGKVVSIAASRVRDARGIVTDIAVRVEIPVKHTQPGEVIHLTIPGGTVGGVTACVEGVPDFSVGERALLYVDRLPTGDVGVLGWRQGKWSVEGGRLAVTGAALEQVISDIRGCLGLPRANAMPGLEIGRRVTLRLQKPLIGGRVPQPSGNYRPGDVVTMLNDGFESEWFWAVGGEPTWGATTYRASTGTHSAYCAAYGYPGVDAPGPYKPSMWSSMVVGPFDLSDAAEAHLYFDLWIKTPPTEDGILYGASKDGLTWDMLAATGSSDKKWVSCPGVVPEVDLKPLLGEERVTVGFLFFSDKVNQLEGAYLDNVQFVKTLATGKTPVITSITPSSASGNTNTVITIKGRLFGAQQDAGSVRFPSAGSIVLAPIVSWTDGAIKCKVPKADSGGITVQGAGGKVSLPKDFKVTFDYAGSRLPTLPDTCTYHIGGTPDVSNAFPVLDASFLTWMAVPGTKARVKRLADTENLPNLTSQDKQHILAWMAADFPGTSDTPSLTITWTNQAHTKILDHDLIFNQRDFAWGVSGTPNRMDIQNTATHEIGHWWGLADMYGDEDKGKTMYGLTEPGHTEQRTLEPEDAAGVVWLYPGTGAGIAGASGATVLGLTALPVRGGAEVTFTLSAPASVAVRVVSIAGRPIRTVCLAEAMSAGRNRVLWDGRSDDGLSAPNGTYLVQVSAATPEGARTQALAVATIGRGL